MYVRKFRYLYLMTRQKNSAKVRIFFFFFFLQCNTMVGFLNYLLICLIIIEKLKSNFILWNPIFFSGTCVWESLTWCLSVFCFHQLFCGLELHVVCHIHIYVHPNSVTEHECRSLRKRRDLIYVWKDRLSERRKDGQEDEKWFFMWPLC